MDFSYIDRMIDEKHELEEKLSKLHKYIKSENAKELTPGEINLLIVQESIMDAYVSVLKSRIDQAKCKREYLIKLDENKLKAEMM